MESEILKFDYVLFLTLEEASGIVIPQLAWDKGLGDCRRALVDRLLSHRSVHFESFKGSLSQFLRTAQGVNVCKVFESRFCLIFDHIEDLRRVLDLRPWIFYHNLLSVDVLRFIGAHLGAWFDEDNIESHITWLESVRIRVNINVSIPLKRALTLHSEHGATVMVRFSYECLPNFCYLCGKLGYIGQFCDLRFNEGFVDHRPATPYGAWLRASGLLRRLGPVTDVIRPTYVRPSPSVATESRSVHRGAHIFGGFRRVKGGASRSDKVMGDNTVGLPAEREQLAHDQEQLVRTCAKAHGSQALAPVVGIISWALLLSTSYPTDATLSVACSEAVSELRLVDIPLSDSLLHGLAGALLISLYRRVDAESQFPPKSFKFEVAWARMAECSQLISDAWVGWPVDDSEFPALARLNRCSEKFVGWSRHRLRGVHQRIKWLECCIRNIEQCVWMADIYHKLEAL
ncbi:hypothetical protein Salat_0618900 [Sesamum alatum]|uniref:Zinc knuckle CX2CX4HX4C domain-containing protein n=1 Tax=Sesamum alatum TaxID=300844 RepID=A0AAE1YQJ0_9LAMI|nr:hypothetical protein Salat_0618900 [Sesamum alatum]